MPLRRLLIIDQAQRGFGLLRYAPIVAERNRARLHLVTPLPPRDRASLARDSARDKLEQRAVPLRARGIEVTTGILSGGYESIVREAVSRKVLKGVEAVACRRHRAPEPFERRRERLPIVGIVIDHEDGPATRHSANLGIAPMWPPRTYDQIGRPDACPRDVVMCDENTPICFASPVNVCVGRRAALPWGRRCFVLLRHRTS